MKSFMSRLFNDFRLARIIMLSMVTASSAYGFGASGVNTALSGLIGALLSMAGFYLDFLLDYTVDKASGSPRNPLVAGLVSRSLLIILVIAGFSGSLAVALVVSPLLLIPCVSVALVLAAGGLGFLNTPYLRSATLGILQGLYALIGILSAGRMNTAGVLIILFLFFAMTGGRVMGDTRDLPFDRKTGTPSIPNSLGMRFASVFLVLHEAAAYAAGIAAYFIGNFAPGFLYCMLATAGLGTVINILFLTKPVPERADSTNRLSLGLLGGLYVLAMILGRP